MRNRLGRGLRTAALGCALVALCGCPGLNIGNLLDRLQITIVQNVNAIQPEDPRIVVLPTSLEAALLDRQDTILIEPDVLVVTDIPAELTVAELPDITLLGFENLTGFDIFLEYFADGQLQGVLVFDGETLLLDYPCLSEVDVVFEDDFDVLTGAWVAEFTIDALFQNGIDFFCGDALIISILADGIDHQVIPLE